MGISKHGKAGSEPESQDRQRLDVWDLSRGFQLSVSRLYPYPEPSEEPTVHSSQELICGFNLANFRLL